MNSSTTKANPEAFPIMHNQPPINSMVKFERPKLKPPSITARQPQNLESTNTIRRDVTSSITELNNPTNKEITPNSETSLRFSAFKAGLEAVNRILPFGRKREQNKELNSQTSPEAKTDIQSFQKEGGGFNFHGWEEASNTRRIHR